MGEKICWGKEVIPSPYAIQLSMIFLGASVGILLRQLADQNDGLGDQISLSISQGQSLALMANFRS